MVNFHQDAKEFEKNIVKELTTHSIKIESGWIIDHLCYRTDSLTSYEEFKKEFLKIGECLIESDVNGRLIATFKLKKPIEFMGQKVSVVELPAPKKGKITITGFEHFEIVTNLSFDEIKRRYSHCHFDESGLNKKINPELEIVFSKYAIKFHQQSLEEVIEIEKKSESVN